MTESQTTDTENETSAEEVAEETSGNGRSAIAFPYSSLEDAERVASAVFEWGGRDISQDRLAATLDTTVKSSGFRTDIASARTFGLIDGRGSLSLTPLGRALVDPQQVAAARVRAFKSVPLFNAVFEAHQGQVLPGAKGLETEMLRLGVAPKQATRARQLFQRAAQHAGFFDHSPERLVEPRTDGLSSDNAKNRSGNGDDKEHKLVIDEQGVLPSEVAVLMKRVLIDGENWSDEALKQYLSGVRSIYKTLAGQ